MGVVFSYVTVYFALLIRDTNCRVYLYITLAVVYTCIYQGKLLTWLEGQVAVHTDPLLTSSVHS